MSWVIFLPFLGESNVWVMFLLIFIAKTLIREWFFAELLILFFVLTIVIGKPYGILNRKVGLKTIRVSKKMFSLIWLMILTIMPFFIPSTSGLAAILLPIVGRFVGLNKNDIHRWLLIVEILLIYPITQRVANIFLPIQGIVLVQYYTSKISWSKALPWLSGFAVMTFIISSITSLLLGAATGLLI